MAKSEKNETANEGASEQAQRVKILNANWVPASDGGDGRFEIMIVTGDDERHALPAPALARSRPDAGRQPVR